MGSQAVRSYVRRILRVQRALLLPVLFMGAIDVAACTSSGSSPEKTGKEYASLVHTLCQAEVTCYGPDFGPVDECVSDHQNLFDEARRAEIGQFAADAMDSCAQFAEVCRVYTCLQCVAEHTDASTPETGIASCLDGKPNRPTSTAGPMSARAEGRDSPDEAASRLVDSRRQCMASERALAGSTPTIGVRSEPTQGHGLPLGHHAGAEDR